MKASKETLSVEELAVLAQSSRKYHHISPSLVRDITTQEAAKRTKQDDIIKHVRSRLHQAAGAYLIGQPEYDAWIERLRSSQEDTARLRTVCQEIMARHASTSERTEYLDAFCAAIFETVGPVKSIADLACGFNPLAAPWMHLDAGCTYLALDVYDDMAGFLNAALPLVGVQGKAVAANLLQPCPDLGQEFDLVLLLKALPCLEQLCKGASLKLLTGLRARRIAVSFPALSLGGREKGMEEFYGVWFSSLLDEAGWSAKRFQFPRETLYIVQKDSSL
jgi:16S rRNA (guanine(1405)-N(7))-methyltransferase